MIFADKSTGRRSRLWIIGIGVALYLASLALPVIAPFNPTFSTTTYDGADAFSGGWHSLSKLELNELEWWVVSPSWLANPAIWLSMIAIALGRWRLATVASAIGLLFALSVLTWVFVPSLPGFWVWCATATFLLVASVGFESKRSRSIGE